MAFIRVPLGSRHYIENMPPFNPSEWTQRNEQISGGSVNCGATTNYVYMNLNAWSWGNTSSYTMNSSSWKVGSFRNVRITGTWSKQWPYNALTLRISVVGSNDGSTWTTIDTQGAQSDAYQYSQLSGSFNFNYNISGYKYIYVSIYDRNYNPDENNADTHQIRVNSIQFS